MRVGFRVHGVCVCVCVCVYPSPPSNPIPSPRFTNHVTHCLQAVLPFRESGWRPEEVTRLMGDVGDTLEQLPIPDEIKARSAKTFSTFTDTIAKAICILL